MAPISINLFLENSLLKQFSYLIKATFMLDGSFEVVENEIKGSPRIELADLPLTLAKLRNGFSIRQTK